MKNLKVGLLISLLVAGQGLIAGNERPSKVWNSLDQASKDMLYVEKLVVTSLATGAILHGLDDKGFPEGDNTAFQTVGRIGGVVIGHCTMKEFAPINSKNELAILTNSALALGGCTAIGSLGLGLPASQAALGCAALETALTAAIYALNK